jgi:hypothetical protein
MLCHWVCSSLHFEVRIVPPSSLKDEGHPILRNVRITHPTTQDHIPENLNRQQHCCENLKLSMLLVWQDTTHTVSYICELVLVTGYARVHVLLYGLPCNSPLAVMTTVVIYCTKTDMQLTASLFPAVGVAATTV